MSYSWFKLLAKKWIYRGRAGHCPACESDLQRFLEFNGRMNAMCPVCGALERHRFIMFFIRSGAGKSFHDPQVSQRVLHIAPEPSLEGHLRSIFCDGYMTLSLQGQTVDARADLMYLPFRDQSFDRLIAARIMVR